MCLYHEQANKNMSQKLKLLASTGINYVSVQIRRNTHRDGEVCQLIIDDCLTYFESPFIIELMGVIQLPDTVGR